MKPRLPSPTDLNGVTLAGLPGINFSQQRIDEIVQGGIGRYRAGIQLREIRHGCDPGITHDRTTATQSLTRGNEEALVARSAKKDLAFPVISGEFCMVHPAHNFNS